MQNFKDYDILSNIYILCLDQIKEITLSQDKLLLNYLANIKKDEKCKICNNDWYFLSNFNANWYELELPEQPKEDAWLFKMRDEQENNVRSKNDLFYDGKCYYPVVVNEMYRDELYNLLRTVKACSAVKSIAVVFYIQQGAHGERVQGVLKLKQFVNALCEGKLRFNIVYLIR